MERSKESARKVLHELIEPARSLTDDETAKSLLSEELIDRVFEEAWLGQFASSRAEFKTKIREIIGDTIRTA